MKKIQDFNGFKRRWSPEIFSGFFKQLHKLRSLRRSFLHFHFSKYYMLLQEAVTAEFVWKEEKLSSNKEDEDTQLVFHAFHLAKQPFKAIIVSSEETDVRLLCLAFSNIINVPIFQSMRFTISRLVHWHQPGCQRHWPWHVQGLRCFHELWFLQC